MRAPPLETDDPAIHYVDHRVTYAETDRMDRVYYGVFPTWFEIGRTEFLRDVGLRYRDIEESGLLLPVRSTRTRFHAPVLYDELIRLATAVSDLRRARVRFVTAVYGDDATLRAVGEVELACIGAKGRPTALPEAMRARLAPWGGTD